jgi:glycosyltransferase involved in cell wall biosynthesis
MNVLHLTISFSPGGRRRAIVTLADHLRKRSVRSFLGCLDELGCLPTEVAGVFDSYRVFGHRSAFDWTAIRQLGDYCQNVGIEIIHAHDAASQFMAALLRTLNPRYKLLMTFHRSLGSESATARDRARNAFANLFTAAVVTGSSERRQHYLSENFIQREKVIRIPFGIDTCCFSPDPAAAAAIRSDLGLSRDTFIVGAVGHFGQVKGLDAVVRGFQRLSVRSLPAPVAMVVVGSGTEAQEQSLRALAAAQPSAKIILAGFQSDVHRWMNAFDLFAHAPRLEAFGLVLVEAMASRLPVVATRIGGVPDIVRDGLTGILVSPDAPEQLADATQRLLCNPELREAMAAAGHRIAVTEYSAERYADRYLDVYQALLHGRRPWGIDQLNRIAS